MRLRTKLSAQFSLAAVLVLLTVSLVAGSEWVPKLEDRVTDTANILSGPDRKRLIEILARYERETFHQIADSILTWKEHRVILTSSCQLVERADQPDPVWP